MAKLSMPEDCASDDLRRLAAQLEAIAAGYHPVAGPFDEIHVALYRCEVDAIVKALNSTA
jgi:hypothetical protein